MQSIDLERNNLLFIANCLCSQYGSLKLLGRNLLIDWRMKLRALSQSDSKKKKKANNKQCILSANAGVAFTEILFCFFLHSSKIQSFPLSIHPYAAYLLGTFLFCCFLLSILL